MANFKELLPSINTFIFDVDGVLTDGSVLLLSNGEQARIMNNKDGFALQHAVKKGYTICVISGGSSEAVRIKLNGLGIT
ncbi:MAG: 3-deoxy-D-manno-octulosonate 8-phosphate phosphatase, partial [Flavobacteriales bacterium CG_4_9_14_0_2_um_filter_32_27]